VTAVALAALSLADVLAGTGGALVAPAPAELALASVSIDSRTLEPGALFVAVVGPRFDGHDFLAEAAARGAAGALVHREVAAPAGLPLVRVADTTRGLCDLARHVRRQAALPVVGVTGSVGKTTTKDMTAHLLATRGPVLRTEGNLNNQYGLPLTLLRLRREHTAAVLEMGMSAPGEIRALAAVAEPDVATITRVAPVHLEFFPSVDAIAEAKAEILEGLRPGGAAVLNGEDPRVVAIGERFGGRVVWFGRDRRFDVSAENERGEEREDRPSRGPSGERTERTARAARGTSFDLVIEGRRTAVSLPLAGAHFVSNFLAAAAAAHVLGVSPEAMAEAATSLRPARHRGEVRRLGEGVTLLDDCYNSSPAALEAALAALALVPGRRRVAILGDMLELGPTGPALHRAAGQALAGRVDLVVGVGALAGEIVEGAREAGLPAPSLLRFDDAARAVEGLGALVRPGDAVLVKASRGVRLEAVVDALLARFGEGEA
jgi:UDP-N-acetylmuramoyl-tripeptide--D-alanyl-D-alanine ligase